MQRPGVAGNHQPRATCERDQLSDTAIERKRIASAGRNHGLHKGVLIRPGIYECFQIMSSDVFCNFTKTFCGPLLPSPTSSALYIAKAPPSPLTNPPIS